MPLSKEKKNLNLNNHIRCYICLLLFSVFFASAHIWKFWNNSHFFFLLLFCLIFGEYKFISVLTWIIEIYYSHFVFVSETLRKSPRIIESQIHDTGEMAMQEGGGIWGVL